MIEFRFVTDQLSVSSQLSAADVDAAAKAGFRTIVNNRPDGEEPGQPAGQAIAAAAQAAGLAYREVPIRGVPGPEAAKAMGEVLGAAQGPVLAFCRSGNRSILAWSLWQKASGARSRDELVGLGHAAGYDLSGVLGG